LRAVVSPKSKLEMFTPRKCGVKFDPPTLVVYYEVNLTGILSSF